MTRELKVIAFSFALCFLICGTTDVSAQVTTADIVGTVTDATGGVIPGATVTVKNLATGVSRSMQTTETGAYAFNLLPSGTYSVTIEMSGFKTFTAPSVVLAAGDRARVDAKMAIGDITETVEVSAETAGAIQTDSATVGGLLTQRAVHDLPVNGRNSIRLVQLTPGANESNQSTLGNGTRPDDRRQTSSVSVNGIHDSANNFLLDGMDNNERAIATIIVKPSIDALQEVRIQTNLYGADVGRAGGAVINMITKSGTNSFNGTLFEFLRNDVFDAKDFFNVPQPGNPLAGKKPPYRQNQFGGSIGGPIKQDKTFFFADYEALRIVQGQTRSVKIPTACQLGREACNGVKQIGNFSDIPKQLYNPFTKEPLPNNIMPLSIINPVGANFANLYPTLTSAACPDATNCQFVSNPKRTQFAHTGDVRIDHNFDQNNTLFFRYSINDTQSFFPGWLPDAEVAGIKGISVVGSGFGGNFNSTAYQRQQSGALSYTHIFRPTLILQTAMQVARFVTDSEPLNKGNMQDKFGGPANLNASYPGLEGLGFIWFTADGYGGLGDQFALPTAYWDTNYQFVGNMIWSKSSHNIKFGGSALFRRWSQFQQLFKGGFQVGNQISGNAMVNLLAGTYFLYLRDVALTAPQYRSQEYGMYLQDDWRVNSWLTLNLGVRYDIFTPLTEKHNALSNFDITKAEVRKGGKMWIAGRDGISRTVNIETQLGDIQPRLGFAASTFKGLVVRGGFGMSYHPTNVASPAQMKNAPFTSTATVVNAGLAGAPVPPFTFSNPLPPVVPNPTCLSASCGAPAGSSFTVAQATDQDYKYSRIYMYNLMVEKEFAGNVLTLGYVGLAGRNLGKIFNNANIPVAPNDPGGCGIYPAVASCQPYYSELPMVSRVQLLRTNGSLNYNAAQIILQRRYRAGLTMSSSYTYGRGLSDTGGPGGACTGCGYRMNDVHYDYGNSDYDVRHRFVFMANYELPFGRTAKGIARHLIGGWEMNGVFLQSTGTPYTVINSEGIRGTNSFQGTSSGDRPEVLPQPKDFKRTLDRWFDITAFQRQPVGTSSKGSRNTLYMPPTQRVDLSIFKSFPITEEVRLQFRTEFFNLFNHPAFGTPGSTISAWSGPVTDPNARPTSAGNFGKITSMNVNYTPRDIQFALKLIF